MSTRKKKPRRADARREAIAYIRVSTEEQAKHGVSLKVQRQRAKDRAKAADWNLVAIEADEGKSAWGNAPRPNLERAIEHVCAARGVLLVYSFSRLTRSLKEAIRISERLRAAGADLCSLSDNVDTTTAMGKAFFHIVAMFAQLESDLTSERVRAAKDYARRQRKKWWGKFAPYGWRMSRDRSHVVQVRSEQKWIAKMRRWRGEGKSFGDIAHRLQRAKVKTKRGRVAWGRMTIRRILLIDARLMKTKRLG